MSYKIQMSDYGEKIYKILSKIVKLDFKAQINRSGISLKKIYKMIDLESGEESYMLEVNNNTIRFINQSDFIQKFINLIKFNINALNERNKELRDKENEAIVDEYAISAEDDYIGYCRNKQSELLNKTREFRDQNIKS